MKQWFLGLLRMVVVAVVTTGLVVVLLGVVYGEQTRRQTEAADEIRRAGLAQVCVLALPIDDSGRDQASVDACLRKYGIEP